MEFLNFKLKYSKDWACPRQPGNLTHSKFRPTWFGNRPIRLRWWVGDGFWDTQPDSDESIGNYLHLNTISTYPTDSTTKKAANLHRLYIFLVNSSQIRRDLVEIWCDLVEIQWDLFEIRLDPARSCHKRPVLSQIRWISIKFALFSARSDEFRPNLTPIEARPPSDKESSDPTWVSDRSTAGLKYFNPTWLGRSRVGLKPDPNQLVVTSTFNGSDPLRATTHRLK